MFILRKKMYSSNDAIERKIIAAKESLEKESINLDVKLI